MKHYSLLLLSIWVTLIFSPLTWAAPDTEFNFPELSVDKLKKLSLYATHYYDYPAKEQAGGVPLLNTSNKSISVEISKLDWCKGAIEGTIQITSENGDKKTFNYADKKGALQVDCKKITGIKQSWINSTGKSRFAIAKGIFGDGVNGYALIPYRTIAVDKQKIPFRSVIYIPKARGVNIELPSGIKVAHDGYFFAGDTGGAIKGEHIDVFSGVLISNPFPNFVDKDENFRFDAYLVEDKDIKERLLNVHLGK
jgi:3D (Asp-Asp-Asp) domain-containing protein